MSKAKTFSLSYPADDEKFITFLHAQHNVSESIRLLCLTWFDHQQGNDLDYAKYINKMGIEKALARQHYQSDTESPSETNQKQDSSPNKVHKNISNAKKHDKLNRVLNNLDKGSFFN